MIVGIGAVVAALVGPLSKPSETQPAPLSDSTQAHKPTPERTEAPSQAALSSDSIALLTSPLPKVTNVPSNGDGKVLKQGNK